MTVKAAGKSSKPGVVSDMKTFPIGAKVLVDHSTVARVKQVFPEGSSSYLWPHYKLDIVGGDTNVAISMNRVSTEKIS